IREAKSSPASRTPSVRQAPVLPVQFSTAPATAAIRQQPGGRTTRPSFRPPQRQVRDTLPSLDLLDTPVTPHRGQSHDELEPQKQLLKKKLEEFGVKGEVVKALPGPVITMYEFAPAAGVRVNTIANLQDDLALVMEAVSVRVVAPVPGKAVVGIEI